VAGRRIYTSIFESVRKRLSQRFYNIVIKYIVEQIMDLSLVTYYDTAICIRYSSIYFAMDILLQSIGKIEGSIFLKTACVKIHKTLPFTRYLKLSNSWCHRLSSKLSNILQYKAFECIDNMRKSVTLHE